MLDIDEEDLAQIIRPVSFYNNKAKHIKKIAAILKEQARGADVIDIPDTYEGLLALPGIGPKIATLVMTLAWNKYVVSLSKVYVMC
jgi:endonuclease-3